MSNPNETITALLNEASELEDRALKLRDVAKALAELASTTAAVKTMRKVAADNGLVLSAVPVRTRKKTPKAGKKRKYTKRSTFWKKK